MWPNPASTGVPIVAVLALGGQLSIPMMALVGGNAGLKACIVVMAVGFVLQALIIVFSPLLRLRALPTAVA